MARLMSDDQYSKLGPECLAGLEVIQVDDSMISAINLFKTQLGQDLGLMVFLGSLNLTNQIVELCVQSGAIAKDSSVQIDDSLIEWILSALRIGIGVSFYLSSIQASEGIESDDDEEG